LVSFQKQDPDLQPSYGQGRATKKANNVQKEKSAYSDKNCERKRPQEILMKLKPGIFDISFSLT
jgi:hypothetical protein